MSTLSSPELFKNSASYLMAPFGTGSEDVVAEDVKVRKTKLLSITSKSVVTLFDGNYVAKLWRTDDLPRELEIIIRAADCAVSLIGRMFHEGKVKGIVMPYEAPLDPSATATKEERMRIIHELCELVRRLHDKDIIHGDIKPTNLLRCSDGRLRFCDFGCASVEGDGFTPNEYTTRYASPWRVRNDEKALSKAEDLYATGVTLWEIYTGNIPFPEIEEDDDVEDPVKAGIRPDVGCIDNPTIATLISSYLDSGPPLRDDIIHTATVCIETEFRLQMCSSDPPHTYFRVSQCWNCIQEGNTAPCPRRFVAARVTDTTNSPVCATCNPGVMHRGL